MEKLHFLGFNLAGFSYYKGVIVFDELKIGSQLRLERELNNKYDPKAVAIYFGEHKLGYIPRNSNSEISKFCEQGYSNIFDVRINRISPTESPEEQIGVAVFIVENIPEKTVSDY